MSDSEPETEYELESFVIGGHGLQITTVAYLPIELLMINREKQTEISGQKLWCGSLGVIQYILNDPTKVKDKVVVEMGAGTGVLGMICTKCGASRVILTDHDQISLNHMVLDCERNGVTATVARLDWYNPDVNSWSLHETEGSNGLLVVAGDVMYKAALLEPFFNTAVLLLQKRAGSLLYLCHIPRAGVNYSDVLSAADAAGLVAQEVPRVEWDSGDCFQYCDPDDLARARLYVFRMR